ncbi:MAG TPA: hypothetical protein VF824_19630 [Thermoanaerobaculia bacterium]|jgi:hypothetical protein
MSDHDDDPFDYGDRTTFQLRNQQFALDDYGTVMNLPVPEPPAPIEAPEPVTQVIEEAPAEIEATAAPVESAPSDPLARIEQKLDAALAAIEFLRRRVDSIDVMLARVLNRD